MGTLQKIGTRFEEQEDEEKEKIILKLKKQRGMWLQHFGSVEQGEEKQSDPESFFFDCEIYTESNLPLNKKFNNKEKKTADCSSKHPFCTDCISKYIQAKVVDNNSSDIVCPDFDCKVNLDILSCQSIVAAKVFVRWSALLCESEILSKYAQNLAYCPHCFECVLNECGDSIGTTKSKCPNCKKLFCFSCVIPLIEGESHTCSRQSNGDAINLTEKNDLLLMQTARENAWIGCPTCKHYVERISGCHVITCRCRTQFCYKCGRNLLGSGYGYCGCAAIVWHPARPPRWDWDFYLEVLSWCVGFGLFVAWAYFCYIMYMFFEAIGSLFTTVHSLFTDVHSLSTDVHCLITNVHSLFTDVHDVFQEIGSLFVDNSEKKDYKFFKTVENLLATLGSSVQKHQHHKFFKTVKNLLVILGTSVF